MSLRRMASLSLVNLIAPFQGLSLHAKKRTEQRENALDILEPLYIGLDKLPTATSFNNKEIFGLGVDVQALTIESDEHPTEPGDFFKPWSVSKLQSHEKNMESEVVQRWLPRMEFVLKCEDRTEMGLGPGPPETWEWGRHMCDHLVWEVAGAPRMGTEGSSETIKSLIRWRWTKTLPDDDRFQPRFVAHQDSWCPGYYWIKSSDLPHIKICMYHNTDGNNDEILREELLVIIAAIASRIESERLKDHLVIPVMLFSFMGEKQGRILLAHFNGQKIVVRMSKLYRFLVEDHDSLFLFTRYLASEINSQDTKWFP